MRAIPGLVPLTLTVALTVVSPLTTLPSAGEVKHTVTEYAPDEGVLAAQVLLGLDVGVGLARGVEVGVGLATRVGVGLARGVEVGVGLATRVGVGLARGVEVGVELALGVGVGVLVGRGEGFPRENAGLAGTIIARTNTMIMNK
jgi:hypothetical protein